MSKRALIPVLVAFALVVLGPGLAMARAVEPLTGFRLYLAGGILGMVLAGGSVFRILTGQARVGMGLWGLAPAAIVLAPALLSLGSPPVNDVTTTPDAPPEFVYAPQLPENHGRTMAYASQDVAAMREHFRHLQPLALAMAPEAAFAQAVEQAEAMPGWELTYRDDVALAFEGIAETAIFHFTDDFVVQIRPGDDGATVHMRSKSRVGKGDLGTNAARIHAYFQHLRDSLPRD